ncbi:MAG: T9SS type A sorting domain-containing protein [Marinoscillum sp.]
MKSKILVVLAIVVATGEIFAQGAIHNLDFDVQRSEVSIIDIDGDGDRDILIIGENPNGRFVQMFQNNGSMEFEKVESVFTSTWVPSVDFGDINADGRIDAIHSGFADTVVVNIYTADTEGVLALNDIYKDLVHIAPGSGITELNNDGIADLFVFGNHNIGDGTMRPMIYFGDGEGGFTGESLFDTYKFIDSKVTDVDIDNDGDMDLWVMAGYEEGVDARFARLFINDNGEFTETDPEIIAKGPGSSDFGDYDGDGDLDLLIGGWGYVNSGEESDLIYRLYKNTNGEFTEVTDFSPFGQFGVGDGGRFADWDNDGDLDVLVTGWNPDAGEQRTAFFINNSGTFTAAEYGATVPGVSESAMEIGDLDDDGDLDLVVNGFSGNNWNGDGSAYGKNSSVIIENTTAGTNAAPSAPTNLVATASGKSVTFSWDEATDDKTPGKSLTYNLVVVDSEGIFYSTPLADTVSGKLTVQEKGNVQLNESWKIKNMPYGEYRWGVQAIDNSFAGSVFAMADFSHIEGGPLPLHEVSIRRPLVYPNPVVGQVKLNSLQGISKVQVHALDGRKVLDMKLKETDDNLNISLESGVYVLRAIYRDGKILTEKIIIQ